MALLADQSADVNSNLVTGEGTESVVYTVPGGIPVKVESVVATITNAGVGTVTPELTIRDQSGVVIARKAQRTTIPAGDSGTATFALRLDDDEAAAGSGQSVADLILATGPYAFWKLDEAAGTIAADSSGNSHHLKADGTRVPPTWGQAVAPPGETSALFVDDTTALDQNADVATVAFLTNFTAGVWVNIAVLGGTRELVGQGTAGIHIGGGGHGWALTMAGTKAAVFADGVATLGDNVLSANTWYFLALVNDAGTWKLYVDGVLQSATQATNIATGSTTTWLGNDGFLGHGSFLINGLLAYAFIVNSVLTAAQLLSIATG